MNNSIQRIQLGVSFDPEEGFDAKNSDQKSLHYSPFKFCESAKMKAKIIAIS
jgi:hypothetical protein